MASNKRKRESTSPGSVDNEDRRMKKMATTDDEPTSLLDVKPKSTMVYLTDMWFRARDLQAIKTPFE